MRRVAVTPPMSSSMSLSAQERDPLRRRAALRGNLVHPEPTDATVCARYDAEIDLVQQIATDGLVATPFLARHPGGEGSDRSCLARVTARGLMMWREAAVSREGAP